jgi:GTP pyrophosphokinase
VKPPALNPAKSAIVQLADVAAPSDAWPEHIQLERARAFSEPLLHGQPLATGEDVWAHANAVAVILQGIGATPSLCAAVYLVYAGDYLTAPQEMVTKAFGESYASVVMHTRKLVQLQRSAREAQLGADERAQQTQRVRKMLLAFSRDLRVVLLRLASRLQTLRFLTASKLPCAPCVASEALHVFAPLANRLGIWQIKWEMEDLAFRCLEPTHYQHVARLLDERRIEREQQLEAFRHQLATDLAAHGWAVQVQGRPKHIYSIWKKMQGKQLDFSQVLDVRAVRVITADVPTCYTVLGRIHELFSVVAGEFDDYIDRPKPNGYQSLHTVVQDALGRPVEVQIRTKTMHEHAEHGVAAHWAYKDAGAKGYAGVQADAQQQTAIAQARKAVLHQLLAWERDTAADMSNLAADRAADRIYVLTPDATVIELPAGATPIDLAYTVHTSLGHRCRGARVDGTLVALNTVLHSGQTVEIVTIKDGGPSLDWLNPELGYLKSPRSKAKVRAWFNAISHAETMARGREAVEKLLQRLGKTAIKLDNLGHRLGFDGADALFQVVGKDEFSLRNIENLLRPPEAAPTADELVTQRHDFSTSTPTASGQGGGVLVVGIESLMTHLARCCRPAPPDAVIGYVTRGKGVAVHRAGCRNLQNMAHNAPQRVISVNWGKPAGDTAVRYSIDLAIVTTDRPNLLRDITELFSKEKMHVVGLKTHQSAKLNGTTSMTLTVQVQDTVRLDQALGLAKHIQGVHSVRRQ